MYESLVSSGASSTPNGADDRSDLELISRVNAGDHAAFSILYYRYRDWVVELAYRFTQDREAALDVLQDTFLYFAKKFPGFQLSAQLKTFLYPCVRNLSLRFKEKQNRYETSEHAQWVIQQQEAPVGESAGDVLAAVVSSLPEGQKEVLLLRFVDGLSMVEMAEALQIPVGTVKSRLHLALERLRADPATRPYFE